MASDTSSSEPDLDSMTKEERTAYNKKQKAKAKALKEEEKEKAKTKKSAQEVSLFIGNTTLLGRS